MRYCDGLSRRDLLQVGALGALGLSLGDFLRMQEAAAAGPTSGGPERSAIFLWLSGGISHIDVFDPKPDAPAEIRGEFKPLRSNVDGVDLTEHVPLLAKQMDKVALIRSLTHNLSAHSPGSL